MEPGSPLIKFTHKLTLITLLFLALVGAAMVFFEIHPFWVDEWFIIHNLKTKSASQLTGQLDFMQQFPRAYLLLVQSFTSFFNFSYWSLRLPSYMVGLTTIAISFTLAKRFYQEHIIARFLFPLIIVSSLTFTAYFVDIKQYTMDILLSVVALYQLYRLLSINASTSASSFKYILLCMGFVVVPFFSYTYPIALAPVYAVIFLRSIALFKSGESSSVKRHIIFLQWLPLILGFLSIAAFYLLDEKQVTSDKGMYTFWSFLILKGQNQYLAFLTGCYTLFAQTGNGLLFETIIGIVSISGFFFAIYKSISNWKRSEKPLEFYLCIYSCLVLILTLLLFAFGKLPVGTPRLNAFTTPSIGILIIFILTHLSNRIPIARYKHLLTLVVYLGVAGNVYSHFINYFSNSRYKKQMQIYVATQAAIRQAQSLKLPIVVTHAITYPYEQATTDAGVPNPEVWVLKTFPAYNSSEIQVYACPEALEQQEVFKNVPEKINRVIACDGINYKIFERPYDVK